MKKHWIDHKCIIVTGASSGIGRELTKRLILEHHCSVIGIARNEKALLSLVQELGENATRFRYRLFDVSKLENWETFRQFLVQEQIQPDVLINNAGILPRFARTEHYSIEEVHNVIHTNFYSALYGIHTLRDLILQSDDPGIINIVSAATFMTLPGTALYCASKSALKSYTEALRIDLAKKAYIGLICPGFTNTNIMSHQLAGHVDQTFERAFRLVSTSVERMTDMILKTILHKKKRMVFGFDARLLRIFGAICPIFGSLITAKIMRKFPTQLFSDVFSD